MWLTFNMPFSAWCSMEAYIGYEQIKCLDNVVCQYGLQCICRIADALNKMQIGLFIEGMAALTASRNSLMSNGEDIPGKISDEILVCKICFGRFSQSKLPKLLSCSHTFCEPCVRQYHSTSNMGMVIVGANDEDPVLEPSSTQDFPCPVCRKTTQLPESGIKGLANNFTVLNLMEIMEPQYGQVDQNKDFSDTCSVSSVQSDTTGLARCCRDRWRRKRRERRGSCCSVFSTPEISSYSMTSLLGIPSIDAKCAICNQRYPESEFPCGHCVCSKCLEGTQTERENDLQQNGIENQEQDNEVPILCPVCPNTDNQSVGRPQGQVQSNGLSGETVADNDNQNNGTVTGQQSMAGSGHIYPCLNLESPQHGRMEKNGNCKDKERCRDPLSALRMRDGIPDERPPPYNPGLYYNNGSADLCPNNGACGSRNGSPRRMPPTHRYSASIVADINLPVTTSSAVSPPSLAFSNPIYSCGAAKQKDSALDQDNYNVSQNSSHSYVSNVSHHSYESPYILQRSQSFQKPPVPPRRHSSSPGIILPITTSIRPPKKRSESAPAPSAPCDECPCGEKLLQESDVYQSPSTLYGVSPPVPPPRRIYDSPHSSPVKCVKKFGKYSEVRMQTSTFRQPTKLAQSEKGDIVVVDEQQMTIQVFTYAGDYLSMFKVIGVQGASFFSADKLAVATHRGISIFNIAGELIKELSVGLSVNTFPYKFGFIACSPKSISIYRQSLTLVKEITKRKTTKSHRFTMKKKNVDPGLFENIKDIAVLTDKNIVVLDSGKGTIHVIDEEGTGKMTINPALETCGKLNNAESLAVDRSNNFFVADTGNQRVLRFTNHGTFSRTLLNCRANPADKRLYPYGVAITDIGNLVVSLAGENAAEVRIYTLQ